MRNNANKGEKRESAPQKSLRLLGINSVPISNIYTLLHTWIFKFRDR